MVRLAGRKKEAAASLLAFAVAAVIRAIPQIRFPYPIGFDTPLYLWFGKLRAAEPSPFRLFEELLGLAYSAGANLLVVMEILPVLVYGLFGFSVYLFAKKRLRWCMSRSFLVSLDASISVGVLRMSWDMHDLMFGLVLLLLTLSFLETFGSMRWRAKMLFGLLTLATLLTHQLVTVILLAVLLAEMVKGTRGLLRGILTLTFVAGGTILLGVGFAGNYGSIFQWVPRMLQSAPFSGSTYELNLNGGLLLTLYGLSMPFAAYGFFRERSLVTWFSIAMLGSLATFLIPTFMLGGVPPWRYILLLAIPVAFYAVDGMTRLMKGRAYRLLPVAILLVNIGSLSFLGLVGGLSYYQAPGLIPPNMLQSSIPEYNIGPMISLLQNLHGTMNATLLVQGDWVGWALYYSDAKVIGFGGIYNSGPSLSAVLNQTTDRHNLFLLWWDAPQAEALGFSSIANDSGLQLFRYGSG